MLINPYVFGYTPTDANAIAYIAAVEAADGIGLESGVKQAINNFVVGCKADGIWNAIKASCILAGARTLAGALVPLVGAAPTNNNFVSGDYNRKTGLKSNGSTKYLNSNRNNNADPQNNAHLAVFVSSPITIASTDMLIGAGGSTGASGSTHLNLINYAPGDGITARNRNSSSNNSVGAVLSPFVGMNRSSSANYVLRARSANTTYTVTSQTPLDANVQVFANEGTFITANRIAFYSIGESLDLALLDTRITALINAFAAAIP